MQTDSGRTEVTVVEQAAIINLRLSDQRLGTRHERFRLTLLEGDLDVTLGEADMQFGGKDLGEGFCVFYCYGTDANAVYEAIRPLIDGYGPGSGSYVIKRFGSALDPTSDKERIEIG